MSGKHFTFEPYTYEEQQEWKEFLEKSRIDQIGQNGNDGLHYAELDKLLKSTYNDWVLGEFIFKEDLNFFVGNVMKYVYRYKRKNGKQDLLKAKDYLDKLISLEYPE